MDWLLSRQRCDCRSGLRGFVPVPYAGATIAGQQVLDVRQEQFLVLLFVVVPAR